jgi:hypothetical protein
MGAWDYGPFDNDGAWDCIGALAEQDPAKAKAQLRAAMTEVVGDVDYIENPEAQGAVAAAVLIGIRLGAPVADRRITELLETRRFEPTSELRAMALRTLDRLQEPEANEWRDLWLEAESLDRVLDLLRPYRETLEQAVGGAEAA